MGQVPQHAEGRSQLRQQLGGRTERLTCHNTTGCPITTSNAFALVMPTLKRLGLRHHPMPESRLWGPAQNRETQHARRICEQPRGLGSMDLQGMPQLCKVAHNLVGLLGMWGLLDPGCLTCRVCHKC